MPKYLTNSKYFDDGAGTHIENGKIECLQLFLGNIDIEDIIQVNIDTVEAEINAINDEITTINNEITTINNEITTINGEITTINGEITTINTDINNLENTLTLCSYSSANNSFDIAGNESVTGTLTLYSGTTPYSLNTFVSNTNSSISGINTTLTNCFHNSTFNAFSVGGNTDLEVLNSLYLYSSPGVRYSLNNFVNDVNTDLNSVINKTTAITYSGTTTSIANDLVIQKIDGFTKAEFDNAINQTYDLSSNAQAHFTTLDVGLAAVGVVASGAAAVGVTNSAAIAATDLVVTSNTTAISALETKTSTMTYTPTGNTVNFASKLTATSFGGITSDGGVTCEGLTVHGGINQTHNDDNYIIGNTYVRNFMRFQYGFGIDIQNNGAITIDGSCNTRDLTVSGLSNINGNCNFSGAQTNLNSTNTQIGTGSAATLTINSSTIIPASNMTFQYGSLRTNSIQNYNSGSLSVDCSGNSLQLNSQTVNIGTNQSVMALNTINIGAITSASIINLNGIVNSSFPINTTAGIFQF